MTDLTAARVQTPVRIIHISEITDNPNISSTARLMYVMLRNEMGRDGTVAIYARELARKLGVGEKTVQGLNAELRRYNAIETHGQGTGKPLRYVMLGIELAAVASSALIHHGPAMWISGYYPEGSAGTPEGQKTVHPDASEGQNSSGQKNVGFPPDPLPTREYLNNTHDAREALAPAECVLFEKLKAHGVTPSTAEDLVRKFPDRIEPTLLGVRFRSNIRDVAGFVIKAIRENYPMPVRQRTILERDAAPKPEPPKLSRDEQRHLDLEAQRATDAMLAALPPEARYLLELKAEEHVSRGIFSRLGPDTRREIRRAKQVELAREFLLTGQVPA